MVGILPEFELVADIAVSFVGKDSFAVFQVKIVIGMAALASAVGEVRRRKGKTGSASDSNDE